MGGSLISSSSTFPRIASIRVGVRLVVCACLALGLSSGLWCADGPVDWYSELAEAEGKAYAGSRPMLVDVWAASCAPCEILERTAYVDHRVVAAIEAGFVPVRIDFDDPPAAVERYAIGSIPTLLFLDEEGNELQRIRGQLSAAELLRHMSRIRAGYIRYRAVLDEPTDAALLARSCAWLRELGHIEGAVALASKAQRSSEGLEPAERGQIDLVLAEQQLALGELPTARGTFERLLAEGHLDRAAQARAHSALVQILREQDQAELAGAHLEKLRRIDAALAEALVGG